MSKLERISTPYVRSPLFIRTLKQLRYAVTMRAITDPALASALQVALENKRSFLLRPGLKDW